MASGDENESLGYAGYMWEPEYYEKELFERLSDTDDGGDIGHARSADLTWCTCSFCASMPSLKESTVHAAKNLSIMPRSMGPGWDLTCDPWICSRHMSIARHVTDCNICSPVK